MAKALQPPADDETWQPPPGLIKRRCVRCQRYFSARAEQKRCVTCATRRQPSDEGIGSGQMPARNVTAIRA